MSHVSAIVSSNFSSFGTFPPLLHCSKMNVAAFIFPFSCPFHWAPSFWPGALNHGAIWRSHPSWSSKWLCYCSNEAPTLSEQRGNSAPLGIECRCSWKARHQQFPLLKLSDYLEIPPNSRRDTCFAVHAGTQNVPFSFFHSLHCEKIIRRNG